jgi:hypothetical protein
MDCRPLSPNLELRLVLLHKPNMKENTTTISLFFITMLLSDIPLLRHLIKGAAARQQMSRNCF